MSNTENIERAKKLSARLVKVENNLDRIIAEIATTSETSNIYWKKIDIRIRKEYEEARRIAASWTNKNVPDIYYEQMNDQLQSIKAKKIPGIRKANFNTLSNTNIAKQDLESLISETLSTYAIGYNSGQKTLLRLTSLTQQVNVAEKQIEKNIAQGFIETGSIRGSIKRNQQELLKKSLDGKYITVIDKNGEPEQWKIKSYSELVARTKLAETATQATINTVMSVGGDLVQVSSHNTLTLYDSQFEGKIYSLSGNDPNFPPASDLPPFHPYCLHSISIVFRQALQRDGTLDKQIAFSNNETEIHPTRRSHIPVSQRFKGE